MNARTRSGTIFYVTSSSLVSVLMQLGAAAAAAYSTYAIHRGRNQNRTEEDAEEEERGKRYQFKLHHNN